MRHIVGILLILSGSIFASHLEIQLDDQNPSEINARLTLDSFDTESIVDEYGSEYIRIMYDDAVYTDLEGYPCYPYSVRFILGSPNSNVSLEIEDSTWEIQLLEYIATADMVFPYYRPNTESETPFWTSGVFLGDKQEYPSFSITPIYIFPFAYDESTGELSILSECTFSVSVDPLCDILINQEFLDMFGDFCLNYNAVIDYVRLTDTDVYDYLVIYTSESDISKNIPTNGSDEIIPDSEYRDAVTSLMNYRESLGHTIHWAYLPPPVTSSMIQSRINLYLTMFDNIKFILLVGDHETMPSNVFEFHGELIYSDTKYNVNCMGPNIGRLPGPPQTIEYVCDKIIEYEEYYENIPERPLCNNVVLMAHEQAGYKANCEEIANDTEYVNDLDFIKYYREDGPIEGSNIRRTINRGVGIVSYRGHGSRRTYGWDVPTFFSQTHVSYLYNNLYPVVLKISCLMGEYNTFSLPSCIAETWLCDRDGGASGVFAATGNTYTSPNNVLHELIFDKLFKFHSPESRPYVARKVFHALHSTIGFHPTWTAETNYYRYIWFGDPGQRLWTEESAINQEDNSNTVTPVSNTELIICPSNSIFEISYGPSPASYPSIAINSNCVEAIFVDVSIFELSGRMIDSKAIQLPANQTSVIEFNNIEITPGVYYVMIWDNSQILSVQSIVILD